MSERVWCVPADLVHERRPRDGFWRWSAETENDAFVAELNATGRFLGRDRVETDEAWRQVIPYVLLRDPHGRYFVYRRLPASGEARLVDLHSLGVGGHINDEALVAGLTVRGEGLRPNLIADALHRELREELVLDHPADGELGTMALLGFLALSATPVDRVHVGVVTVVELAAEHVGACDVRERDKLAAVGWYGPDQLRRLADEVPFEGWSRTLIEAAL